MMKSSRSSSKRTDMNKTILEEAARRFGTPCYVISGDDFARRANAVKEAFGENTGLCYSIKANPFLLKYLPDAFSYIEVCSPGELSICEELSVPMSKVIFSGVTKPSATLSAPGTTG